MIDAVGIMALVFGFIGLLFILNDAYLRKQNKENNKHH